MKLFKDHLETRFKNNTRNTGIAVIVGHGEANKILIKHYFGLSIEEYDAMKTTPNCTPLILELNDSNQRYALHGEVILREHKESQIPGLASKLGNTARIVPYKAI
jgi:broad specificity phosphatase PhoE